MAKKKSKSKAAAPSASPSAGSKAFDPSAPIVHPDEIRAVAGPAPDHGRKTGDAFTRADLVKAIEQGGSVLHNGQLIRSVGQLPSQKDLDAYVHSKASQHAKVTAP